VVELERDEPQQLSNGTPVSSESPEGNAASANKRKNRINIGPYAARGRVLTFCIGK
jgi:hypothetical protein